MNRIDAFFVGFSLLLVWCIFIYLAPNNLLAGLHPIISGIAIGIWIGNFVYRLEHGSPKKELDGAYALMDRMYQTLSLVFDNAQKLKSKNDALQAKIDALMLEFCPQEMTPEQLGNWGANQTVIDPETQEKINKALKDSLH